VASPCFAVPVPTSGALFIMPCPAVGAMAEVLDSLRLKGVTVVLSMLPDDEAHELGAQDEAILCAERGITHLSFPIPDFGLPDVIPFAALIADLTGGLKNSENIAVHCRAGIGRSGMVAACMLIALGDTAAAATAKVSDAREVSIPDTVEQGRFIASFTQRGKSV